jgi:hypothetical protein
MTGDILSLPRMLPWRAQVQIYLYVYHFLPSNYSENWSGYSKLCAGSKHCERFCFEWRFIHVSRAWGYELTNTLNWHHESLSTSGHKTHPTQCTICCRITINERSILLIKLSVDLVRKNVCSLKKIELSKHVGAIDCLLPTNALNVNFI